MTRGKYHITWYNKKKRKTRLKCIGFPAQEFQYLIVPVGFGLKLSIPFLNGNLWIFLFKLVVTNVFLGKGIL